MLCNSHKLYVAFKEQNPDVKVGFSKFCSLHPEACVITGKSGTYSVCVSTIHQCCITCGCTQVGFDIQSSDQ